MFLVKAVPFPPAAARKRDVARIRSIKPEFFIDEDVAALPPLTRILFTGLWCLADKEGRLEDRPQRIKIQILPYDNHDIDKALALLCARGYVVRYEAEGKKVIWIKNFLKHQRPHHTEAPSELPPYNGELTVTTPLNNGDAPVSLGREGKGREGKVKAPSSPAVMNPQFSDTSIPKQLKTNRQSSAPYRVVAEYARLWAEAYGGKVCISTSKMGMAKCLIRDLEGEEAALSAVKAYFVDTDQWLVERCHPLERLCKASERWAPKAEVPDYVIEPAQGRTVV